MIITVTLNPCIDRTVLLDTLTVGGHNRAAGSIEQVCGKGVNVSAVLRHLKAETLCVGFNYTDGGTSLTDTLASQGIPCSLVDVPGRLRVNIKLTESGGRMTEINENGMPVSAESVEQVMAEVQSVLPGADLLVVDGSVPPGVPKSIYADMIRMGRDAGVRTVLDASGALLAEGLKAAPWMAKPNRFELETLLGVKLPDIPSAARAARSLLESGTELVCLSLGSDGALLASRQGTWFCGNLDIAVQGVQGAGDSMVAGFCAAALQGLPEPEMLKWGVAAAHASLLLPGTELCRREDFECLLPQLTVEKLFD